MIFFKKKPEDDGERQINEYFKYRDSLTGCMTETFAIKEFYRVKSLPSYGAALVRVKNAENMPMYKGERLIKETACVLTNIYPGDIFRLKYGDFLIFTENCENTAEKINGFLYRLQDNERQYAVGAERFDRNEKEYTAFMRRLTRSVALAEKTNGKKAIY